MSTTLNSKMLSWKDVLFFVSGVGAAVLGAWIKMEVNIASLKNDMSNMEKRYEKEINNTNQKVERLDEKLDYIIESTHRIELQLKDKEDRKLK